MRFCTALCLMLGLLACACARSTAAPEAEAEAGFQPLFNGRDLSNWTYGPDRKEGEGYLIRAREDGVSEIYCTPGNGGNLYTEKSYGDFILRFEVKLTPGANNGIGIRAPVDGRASRHGLEIQVLDDTAEQYKDLRPTQYHGSVYDLFPAERGHQKPLGEWNEQEIAVRGSRITVKLNAATIVNADLDSIKDPEVLEKHPGIKNRSGHIGFLGHGSEVSFRKIRIKPL